jgi:hypothetical protein
VTVGGPGFNGTTDDDRLSPTTNLPILYQDDEGNETKTNPLTTDVNGLAYAFAAIAPYDALVSGGTPALTPFLISNHHAKGGDAYVANAWGTGTQVLYNFDSLRDLVAGDKHIRGSERGVELWSISDAGKLTLAGGLSAAAAASVVGGLTVSSGGMAVTGNSTIVGTLASLTGITMTSGDFDTTGGTTAVRAARLKANRGTALVAGDFALGAGWGTGGASVTSVVAGSCDSRGAITIVSGTAAFSANPTVTLTFKDGTFGTGGNTICIGYVIKNSGTRSGHVLALNTTGLTSIVWEVIGLTPGVSESFQLAWHTIG